MKDNKFPTIKTYKLIPYANNSRTHSEEQVAQIAASIKEFGFTNPVIIDEDNGIIAGHGRLLAAQKLGLKDVPCVKVEGWSEAQKKAYVIADNKLALNAGWNEEMLALEFAELDELGFDLELTGFSLDEISDIRPADEGLTDDDAVPDIPETPVSIEGDVWILGNHRLMCGDSTDAGSVALLMDGNKADMVFTDPPYGVNYSEKEERLGGKKGHNTITNDDSIASAENVCGPAFQNLSDYMKGGASYYICAPQGGDQMMMMMMMEKANIRCRHELIWVKPSPVFSMGRLDYDYQHEPILYGWKGSHKFAGGGEHKKSIWNIERNKETKTHPTMKPVSLVENAVKNSSKTDDAVLDLFGGSGSTLIACEKTNRKCYMMELDPHYCDVIIKRWEEYTGKKATMAGDTYEDIAAARGVNVTKAA